MEQHDETTTNETVSLSDISLTKEDFFRANWQATISTCTPPITRTYASLFFAKAQELSTTNDKVQEAVYTVLETVCSPYMKLDDPAQPFRPFAVFSEGARSPSIEDLTDNHLHVLAEIFSTVSDPELQARIADILWIRRGKHINNPGQWVRIAGEAYLASARVLEDPIKYTHCIERIERAMQLTAYNGDQSQLTRLVTYIETLLTKYSDVEQKFFSYDLMRLLLEKKQGDITKHIALSDKIAKHAESQHDWYMAACYWRTKAQWHKIAGDSDAAEQALKYEAETFVQDATDSIQGANPSYTRASLLIYQAITAYEQFADTGETRKQLRMKLHEYQKKSSGERKRMGVEIDTSALAEQARNAVQEKPFREALWEFVRITTSPNWDYVRKFIDDTSAQFPLRYLFPSSIVTGEGKWAAHIPPLDKNASQKVIEGHMFMAAQQFQLLNALCLIDPARIQIFMDHSIRAEDFLPSLIHSDFVPPTNVRIYARGLYAGFTGDYLVAAHLLIPQLENSLRYILQKNGEIVTSLDNKGVQNEYSITILFEKYQERLEQLIGRDTTYDLRGLLNEHTGTNFRNRLAHGLIDDAAFMESYPIQTIYLCWLTLRLVVIGELISKQREAQEPPN